MVLHVYCDAIVRIKLIHLLITVVVTVCFLPLYILIFLPVCVLGGWWLGVGLGRGVKQSFKL